jgi:hypothetical protein
VGWVAKRWQVSGAGAFRTMDTEVTAEDVEGNACEQLFGKAGREYSLDLVDLYADFSFDFDIDKLF